MTAASPEAVSRRARAGGRLMLQRCTRCAAAIFPPRLLCPDCGTETLAFFEASHRAHIVAATRIAAAGAGGRGRVIALAQLAEGVTLMGNIQSDESCDRLIGRAVSLSVGDAPQGPDAIMFEVLP